MNTIYKLQNITGGEIDVTKDVKNWDEVEISLSRNDFNGVEKYSATKFEFANNTANKLFSEYMQFGLLLNYRLNIYRCNQNWEYEQIFSGKLDFSTINYDGYIFSIETIPSNFAEQLKANLSTNYDIEYNDIKNANKLHYDRINIVNQLQYTLGENYNIYIRYSYGNVVGTAMRYYCYPIPIAYIESQSERKNQTYSFKDVVTELDGGGFYGLIPPSNNEFMQLETKDKSLRITTDFEFDIYSLGNGTGSGTRATWCDIALVQYSDLDKIKILASTSENVYNESASHLGYLAWDAENGYTEYGVSNMMNRHRINLYADLSNVEPGEKIGLFIISAAYGDFYGNYLSGEIFSNREPKNWFKQGSIMMIENTTKGADKDLECFTPISLANALINKIKTDDINVDCIIDTTDVPCILLSGENIRGFLNPKIHTSFKDFADFMQACFGFTYTIEQKDIYNYILRFGKRENLYINEVTKVIRSYNDFNLSQDTSLIYSNISAGYRNQNTTNDNGKNEYNTTDEYTTGLTITDNKLELISPYRADSFGFEFFVQQYENAKDGEDTKGDAKDNNIFIVAVKEDLQNNKYEIDRSLSVIGNNSELFESENGYYTGIKLVAASYSLKNIKIYYMAIEKINDSHVCEIVFTAGDITLSMRKTFTGDIEDKDINMSAYNPEKEIFLFVVINWAMVVKTTPTSDTGDKKTYVVNTYLSLYSYGTNSFNVALHPRFCIERNYFIIPVATELNFASSECNANACIYDNKGNITYLQGVLKLKESDITINMVDFTTDETELPTEKNALIRLQSKLGVFDGYVIDATQNIGKNQSSTYKILLKK